MTVAYSPVVLEHFRRPRNQRVLERATVRGEAHNPLCGDRVVLELAVAGGVVADVAFTASACAICTASASLLTERVHSQAVADALAIDEEQAVAWLESSIPDTRRPCATLPVVALRRALSG